MYNNEFHCDIFIHVSSIELLNSMVILLIGKTPFPCPKNIFIELSVCLFWNVFNVSRVTSLPFPFFPLAPLRDPPLDIPMAPTLKLIAHFSLIIFVTSTYMYAYA